MAWFADLAECIYLPFPDTSRLRAIGWLERGRPYGTGEAGEAFFRRLCGLLKDAWSPVGFGGVHPCDLCRFTGGGTARYRTESGDECDVPGQAANMLFVPGDGVVYVSPTNVAHYVDAHGYLPPEEFVRAVLECPPMRTTAYFKAILANGGRGLTRGVGGEVLG